MKHESKDAPLIETSDDRIELPKSSQHAVKTRTLSLIEEEKGKSDCTGGPENHSKKIAAEFYGVSKAYGNTNSFAPSPKEVSKSPHGKEEDPVILSYHSPYRS